MPMTQSSTGLRGRIPEMLILKVLLKESSNNHRKLQPLAARSAGGLSRAFRAAGWEHLERSELKSCEPLRDQPKKTGARFTTHDK